MASLAERVDAVVGIDTHRDTHEAEIADATGAAIATIKISNDSAGSRLASARRRRRGQLPIRFAQSECETADLGCRLSAKQRRT